MTVSDELESIWKWWPILWWYTSTFYGGTEENETLQSGSGILTQNLLTVKQGCLPSPCDIWWTLYLIKFLNILGKAYFDIMFDTLIAVALNLLPHVM